MKLNDFTYEQIQEMQELFPFECGYGTGEQYTIPIMYKFMELLAERSYDFQVMSVAFGEVTTWVLIELLARCDLIDWGTSSRFGWITERGEQLRDMMRKFTQEEMYEIVTAIPNDFN